MAAGIPLPSPWYVTIWSKASLYDLLGFLIGLPAAFVAAWKLEVEFGGWAWHLLPAFLLAFAVAKFALAWRKERGLDRIHSLEGALHTLHRLLTDYAPTTPNPKLRLTVHGLSADKQVLIQALDYVGDQRAKKTKGRRTRANCGIIGRALQTKELAVGKRPTENYGEYVEELQSSWHYTEEEARKLNPESMAWLAVPLTDLNNDVIAILFADSVVATFFDDDASKKVDLVMMANAAAAGLAEFVSRKLA